LVFAAANKNNNYLAWKTGELVFDHTYMATVSDVLEEHYDVKVEIKDQALAYCEFSGSFNAESIDDVLKQIHADLKVDIQHSGQIITLSGSGCKPKSVEL
jgi:ferric-dicitrate binding protein FerR (iron transport regulator)